jgi:plastocyanin
VKVLLSSMSIVAVLAFSAHAGETFEIIIKDHKFSPAEITVPANQQVSLVVKNQDATPEEFEGENFEAEKVIPGNSEATILVGPFEPGEYEFVGEFNEASAKGKLIAK